MSKDLIGHGIVGHKTDEMTNITATEYEKQFIEFMRGTPVAVWQYGTPMIPAHLSGNKFLLPKLQKLLSEYISLLDPSDPAVIKLKTKSKPTLKSYVNKKIMSNDAPLIFPLNYYITLRLQRQL